MVYSQIRIFRTVIQAAEVARFVVVGVVGFSINFALLWLQHGYLGQGLLASQLIAGEAALIGTFVLHNSWTYRNYFSEPLWRRLAAYHASAWFGVGLNLAALILLTELTHIYYLLALTISAGAVMVWNFLFNRLIIWRDNRA